MFKVLKPLDTFLWFLTEIFGWLVGEGPYNKESLFGVTSGTVLAYLLGTTTWIILWFIKIPRRHTKLWAVQAALWTFFGLVGGSVLLSIGAVTILIIGETIAKIVSPILGMAFTGFALGAFISSITGLAMIKLIQWPVTET